MTGVEILRKAVGAFSSCREGFLEGFSPDELVRLLAAWRGCEWDYLPDTWGARQVSQAIRFGTPPHFDDDGHPNPRTRDEAERLGRVALQALKDAPW